MPDCRKQTMSDFVYYIKRCINVEELEHLDGMKSSFEKAVLGIREEVKIEDKNVEEATAKFESMKGQFTDTLSEEDANELVENAVSKRDIMYTLLAKFEMETAICNAFYSFVQKTQAKLTATDDWVKVIHDAVVYSPTNTKATDSLAYWSAQ